MARQVRRISDLPEAGPLTGDELLEIVQDGGNKRASVSMLGGGVEWGEIGGLLAEQTDLVAALGEKVNDDDDRLTDAREWTAPTVTQTEAEAGTATTRRAWTAQRVRQAIVAWWDSTASASGKAVATGTPAQGRTALGLGTAATATLTTSPTDTTPGRALRVGDFGVGAQGARSEEVEYAGHWDVRTLSEISPFGGGIAGRATVLELPSVVGIARNPQLALRQNPSSSLASGNRMAFRCSASSSSSPQLLPWVYVYHTGNTTVDSNGFVKEASPIIKLHSDRVETEIEAPSFERIDTGHYRLTGCNGLRLDDGWYIDTPHDRNGNKYFNVEWYQDVEPATEKGVLDEAADVALSIHCYERVWNPSTGAWDNGEPVDIPEGRWIDLRMNEVRQPEPDIPEEGREQKAMLGL